MENPNNEQQDVTIIKCVLSITQQYKKRGSNAHKEAEKAEKYCLNVSS